MAPLTRGDEVTVADREVSRKSIRSADAVRVLTTHPQSLSPTIEAERENPV